MSSSYTSIIVHSMCLLLDGYFMQRAHFVYLGLKQRGWQSFAGEYAFLTQITHTLQTVFFAVLLLFDLFSLFSGSKKPRPQNRKQSRGASSTSRSGSILKTIGDYGFSLLFVNTGIVGALI